MSFKRQILLTLNDEWTHSVSCKQKQVLLSHIVYATHSICDIELNVLSWTNQTTSSTPLELKRAVSDQSVTLAVSNCIEKFIKTSVSKSINRFIGEFYQKVFQKCIEPDQAVRRATPFESKSIRFFSNFECARFETLKLRDLLFGQSNSHEINRIDERQSNRHSWMTRIAMRFPTRN